MIRFAAPPPDCIRLRFWVLPDRWARATARAATSGYCDEFGDVEKDRGFILGDQLGSFIGQDRHLLFDTACRCIPQFANSLFFLLFPAPPFDKLCDTFRHWRKLPL